MRFRFCGDLDCPDWVLAEMNVLARLTSVKMKLLVAQVIKLLLGDEIDMEKMQKLTADAKFEEGDVKACVAGLRFILTKAAKHDVDEETLSSELQQLGLPKEHASGLCKAYGTKLTALQDTFRAQSFRLGDNLESVKCKVERDGEDSGEKILLNLKLSNDEGEKRSETFVMSSDKLGVLLSELKIARNLMNQEL